MTTADTDLAQVASPTPTPTPEQIRQLRMAAGLTQGQAAALLYKTERAWRMWESGDRQMDPAFCELFCVKTLISASSHFDRLRRKPE
jgi:putative transcriptional regulator